MIGRWNQKWTIFPELIIGVPSKCSPLVKSKHFAFIFDGNNSQDINLTWIHSIWKHTGPFITEGISRELKINGLSCLKSAEFRTYTYIDMFDISGIISLQADTQVMSCYHLTACNNKLSLRAISESCCNYSCLVKPIINACYLQRYYYISRGLEKRLFTFNRGFRGAVTLVQPTALVKYRRDIPLCY